MNMDDLSEQLLPSVDKVALTDIDKKSLFEIKRQTSGSFLTKVTPELREARENGGIAFVYQKGIGFVDGSNSQVRFIETSDFGGREPFFGSCVVVIAWEPSTRLTSMLHADTLTDITQAKQLMENRFSGDEVELSVLGGQETASEGILQEISEQFRQSSKWQLKRIDTLGLKYVAARQTIVDIQTGEVYDLQGDDRENMKPWEVDLPDDVRKRQLRAATVEKTLFVDVDYRGADRSEQI